MGFSATKGDVSGAFLQGRNLQRDLWVLPVPELAAALDVAPGEIMKLKKAAYGLVEAPVEWYICISTVLKEHGWRRLKSDPCCWILIDPSFVKAETEKKVTTRSECPVVAATGGHVDDFVFVGKEGNEVWETAKKNLQDHSRWKMWEYDNFLQCGVRVEHQKDGSFLLSQNEFVDELREIQITSQRRKEKDNALTPQEQTELRGLLGGLGWKCEQTRPQYSAATGLQRSRIEQATVQDMIEANRLLLQQVKKESGQAIRIFSFPTEEQLTLIGWVMQHCKTELMEEVRKVFFSLSSVKALKGEESLMSVISWRSGRKERICRSATCAETRAMVDLEEELFALRYRWAILQRKIHQMKWLNWYHDKMQHTVITPKGGHRMPGFEGRFGDFRSQVFLGTQRSTTGKQSH